MINGTKLKIYSTYNGDIDMFLRAGSPRHKDSITDDEWQLIDLLLQDAIVVDRKLGSPERTAQAIERLKASCEADKIIKSFHSMAAKMFRPRRKFLWWTW